MTIQQLSQICVKTCVKTFLMPLNFEQTLRTEAIEHSKNKELPISKTKLNLECSSLG